jgi:hypothetical protein
MAVGIRLIHVLDFANNILKNRQNLFHDKAPSRGMHH